MSLPHHPTPADYVNATSASSTAARPNTQPMDIRTNAAARRDSHPHAASPVATAVRQSSSQLHLRPLSYGGYPAQPPRPAPPPKNGSPRLQQEPYPPYRRASFDANPRTPPVPGMDLLEIFQSVDVNRSGSLTEQELGRALVNGDFTAFDPATVHLMVRMFDVRREGKLGFKEFTGLWNYLAEWRKLFNRFDVDGSGRISIREFSTALHAFGYRLSPEFMRHFFSSFQRGNTQDLSFDMFVQACIILKQATQTFHEYDVNRTGYITISFECFIKEMVRQR